MSSSGIAVFLLSVVLGNIKNSGSFSSEEQTLALQLRVCGCESLVIDGKDRALVYLMQSCPRLDIPLSI